MELACVFHWLHMPARSGTLQSFTRLFRGGCVDLASTNSTEPLTTERVGFRIPVFSCSLFLTRSVQCSLDDAQQIVGRERSQRVSYRQLIRSTVARRRVNSTVRCLLLSHEENPTHPHNPELDYCDRCCSRLHRDEKISSHRVDVLPRS